MTPLQQRLLRIRGEDPIHTYGKRRGALKYYLDNTDATEEEKERIQEKMLGAKPLDVDTTDSMWGEIKRRIVSGAINVAKMPLQFGAAMEAQALPDQPWQQRPEIMENLQSYEEKISRLTDLQSKVPRKREGFGYDVVEQVPTTLSTLGVTAVAGLASGGYVIPALTAYGINEVFQVGEVFDRVKRNDKIEAHLRAKYGEGEEADAVIKQAQAVAAKEASITVAILEAANPFNAAEAAIYGRLGGLGSALKTGPQSVLKAAGKTGATGAAHEFGQEFAQNVASDFAAQRQEDIELTGDSNTSKILAEIDYAAKAYNASVAAVSAGPVSATAASIQRVRENNFKNKLDTAFDAMGKDGKIAPSLSSFLSKLDGPSQDYASAYLDVKLEEQTSHPEVDVETNHANLTKEFIEAIRGGSQGLQQFTAKYGEAPEESKAWRMVNTSDNALGIPLRNNEATLFNEEDKTYTGDINAATPEARQAIQMSLGEISPEAATEMEGVVGEEAEVFDPNASATKASEEELKQLEAEKKAHQTAVKVEKLKKEKAAGWTTVTEEPKAGKKTKVAGEAEEKKKPTISRGGVKDRLTKTMSIAGLQFPKNEVGDAERRIAVDDIFTESEGDKAKAIELITSYIQNELMEQKDEQKTDVPEQKPTRKKSREPAAKTTAPSVEPEAPETAAAPKKKVTKDRGKYIVNDLISETYTDLSDEDVREFSKIVSRKLRGNKKGKQADIINKLSDEEIQQEIRDVVEGKDTITTEPETVEETVEETVAETPEEQVDEESGDVTRSQFRTILDENPDLTEEEKNVLEQSRINKEKNNNVDGLSNSQLRAIKNTYSQANTKKLRKFLAKQESEETKAPKPSGRTPTTTKKTTAKEKPVEGRKSAPKFVVNEWVRNNVDTESEEEITETARRISSHLRSKNPDRSTRKKPYTDQEISQAYDEVRNQIEEDNERDAKRKNFFSPEETKLTEEERDAEAEAVAQKISDIQSDVGATDQKTGSEAAAEVDSVRNVVRGEIAEAQSLVAQEEEKLFKKKKFLTKLDDTDNADIARSEAQVSKLKKPKKHKDSVAAGFALKRSVANKILKKHKIPESELPDRIAFDSTGHLDAKVFKSFVEKKIEENRPALPPDSPALIALQKAQEKETYISQPSQSEESKQRSEILKREGSQGRETPISNLTLDQAVDQYSKNQGMSEAVIRNGLISLYDTAETDTIPRASVERAIERLRKGGPDVEVFRPQTQKLKGRAKAKAVSDKKTSDYFSGTYSRMEGAEREPMRADVKSEEGASKTKESLSLFAGRRTGPTDYSGAYAIPYGSGKSGFKNKYVIRLVNDRLKARTEEGSHSLPTQKFREVFHDFVELTEAAGMEWVAKKKTGTSESIRYDTALVDAFINQFEKYKYSWETKNQKDFNELSLKQKQDANREILDDMGFFVKNKDYVVYSPPMKPSDELSTLADSKKKFKITRNENGEFVAEAGQNEEVELTPAEQADLAYASAQNSEEVKSKTEQDSNISGPNKIAASNDETIGDMLYLPFDRMVSHGSLQGPDADSAFTQDELNTMEDLGWRTLDSVIRSPALLGEGAYSKRIADAIKGRLNRRSRENNAFANTIKNKLTSALKQAKGPKATWSAYHRDSDINPNEMQKYYDKGEAKDAPFKQRLEGSRAGAWDSVFPDLTRQNMDTEDDRVAGRGAQSSYNQRMRELSLLEDTLGVKAPEDLESVAFIMDGTDHDSVLAVTTEARATVGEVAEFAPRKYVDHTISKDLYRRLKKIAEKLNVKIGKEMALPDQIDDQLGFSDATGVLSEGDVVSVTKYVFTENDEAIVYKDLEDNLNEDRKQFDNRGEANSRYGEALTEYNKGQFPELEGQAGGFLNQLSREQIDGADKVYNNLYLGGPNRMHMPRLLRQHVGIQDIPNIPFRRLNTLINQGVISNVYVRKSDTPGNSIATLVSDDIGHDMFEVEITGKGLPLSDNPKVREAQERLREYAMLKEQMEVADERTFESEDPAREFYEQTGYTPEQMLNMVNEAEQRRKDSYAEWIKYAKENNLNVSDYDVSANERARRIANRFKEQVEFIAATKAGEQSEYVQNIREEAAREGALASTIKLHSDQAHVSSYNSHTGSAGAERSGIENTFYDLRAHGGSSYSIAPNRDVGQGIKREEVADAISELTEGYAGSSQHTFIVLNSPEEIGANPKARGMIQDKTIYLFADNIKSKDVAKRVWMHEVVGHSGIESLLGPEEFHKLLDNLVRTRRMDILQIQREDASISSDDAARELIARLAEGKIQRPSLIEKVVNFLKEQLRRIMPNLKISDSEIKAMLFDAEKKYQTGELVINEIKKAYMLGLQQRAEEAITKGRDLTKGWGPLGKIPELERYLDIRSMTQGDLMYVDRVARQINDALAEAPQSDYTAMYEYLTTQTNPELIDGRWVDTGAEQIVDQTARERTIQAKQLLMDMGQGLVNRGMLDGDTYQANKGKYLPTVFMKHILKREDFEGIVRNRKNIDASYLKQQKIDDKFIQALMGKINDPAFLSSRGWLVPSRDMMIFDWMEKISQNKNWAKMDTMIDISDHVPADYSGATKVSAFWAREEGLRLQQNIQEGYITERVDEVRNLANWLVQRGTESLSRNNEIESDLASDWVKMPEDRRYGRLAGMLVHKQISDDIIGTTQIIHGDNFGGKAQKLLGDNGALTQANKVWKLTKVALNPPTQVRNGISNAIMLHLSGVPMVQVPTYIVKAVRDAYNHGPYSQAAERFGIGKTTYSSEELIAFDKEIASLEKRTRGDMSYTSVMQIMFDKLKSGMGKASDAYGFVEKIFKVASIMHSMEQGMKQSWVPFSQRRQMELDNLQDLSDAVRHANEYLLDYSLVTPSVRYLRNAPLGAPFLTFYVKILPALVRSAARNPLAFAPYVASTYLMAELVKQTFDADEDDLEQLQQALPKWIREKNHVYMLPYKDANGKLQFLDLSHVVPWGAYSQLVSEIGRGELGNAVTTIGAFTAPIFSIASATMTGVDPFTGNAITEDWMTPREKATAIMGYAYTMGMPSFLTQNGFAGKMMDAYNRVPDRYGDEKITLGNAALRLAGININAIAPEKTRMTEIKRMRYNLNKVRGKMNSEMSHARINNLGQEYMNSIREEYGPRIAQGQEMIRMYSQLRIAPQFRKAQ